MGHGKLPGTVNYMLGGADNWALNLNRFSSIEYQGVWPGVDLWFSGPVSVQKEQLPPGTDMANLERFLQTKYVVQPGADPSLIRWRYDTGDGSLVPSLTKAGTLVVPTSVGDFFEAAPVAYTLYAGQRTPIDVAFVLKDGVVSLDVGSYDETKQLVIDPFLGFSRRIQGTSSDYVSALREDTTGRYISGTTLSTNWPSTVGAYQPAIRYTSYYDWFAAKFSPSNNTLIFATYLGGYYYDYNQDFVLDNGQMVMVGATHQYYTYSPQWPGNNGGAVVPPFTPNGPMTQLTYRGNTSSYYGYNCAVAKLGAAGNTLPYSTAFGQSELYVPYTTTAYSPCTGIARDPSGNFYVTGTSYPSQVGNDGWPQGGYISDAPGSYDAFVAQLNNTLSTMNYFSYIGQGSTDYSNTVVVDPSGYVYTGMTTLETTSVPMTFTASLGSASSSASYDHVITKFNPNLASVVYNTRIGGTSTDYLGSGTTLLDGHRIVVLERRWLQPDRGRRVGPGDGGGLRLLDQLPDGPARV